MRLSELSVISLVSTVDGVGCLLSEVPLYLSATQGVVIPIGAVVTAATGVKKRSRDQGLFLVSVKQSRTILQTR